MTEARIVEIQSWFETRDAWPSTRMSLHRRLLRLGQLHFDLLGFGVELGDFEVADLAFVKWLRLGGGSGRVGFEAVFEERRQVGQVGLGGRCC